MTDAEVKTSSVPLNFGEVPIDVQRVNSGSEDASGKIGLHARREEAEEVAALREFTVVQGWWNTHVWILKQQLDFDDVLKDPRPQSQRRGSSGSVEAVVVAMQEGSESSRLGQGRVGLLQKFCTGGGEGLSMFPLGFQLCFAGITVASQPHVACCAVSCLRQRRLASPSYSSKMHWMLNV